MAPGGRGGLLREATCSGRQPTEHLQGHLHRGAGGRRLRGASGQACWARGLQWAGKGECRSLQSKGCHGGTALCVEASEPRNYCGSRTVGVTLAGFSASLPSLEDTLGRVQGPCCLGTQWSTQQCLEDLLSQKRTRGPRGIPSLPEDMLTRAERAQAHPDHTRAH